MSQANSVNFSKILERLSSDIGGLSEVARRSHEGNIEAYSSGFSTDPGSKSDASQSLTQVSHYLTQSDKKEDQALGKLGEEMVTDMSKKFWEILSSKPGGRNELGSTTKDVRVNVSAVTYKLNSEGHTAITAKTEAINTALTGFATTLEGKPRYALKEHDPMKLSHNLMDKTYRDTVSNLHFKEARLTLKKLGDASTA